MDEKEVVLGIQRRDEKALEESIKMYGKLVAFIIQKLVGVTYAGAVDEIVNDVFLEIWYKYDQIDLSRGTLKNLLCIIARSRAIDYLRKNKNDRILDEFSDYADNLMNGPEDDFVEKEKVRGIYALVKSLKEPTATVLLLRYFYHYEIDEIAVILKIKREQVDNYLSRGRKKLKGLMYCERGLVNEY